MQSLDPVTAVLLGDIQLPVDGLDEVGGGQPVAGCHCADADADGDTLAVRRLRVDYRQFLDQALTTLGDVLSPLGIGFRQHDDEFLAAVTRDQIARAGQGQVQRLRNPGQALVARDVPVQVVELLEEVDIEQDQRQRQAAVAHAFPFHFQAAVEAAPVGDAGQPVLERQRF